MNKWHVYAISFRADGGKRACSFYMDCKSIEQAAGWGRQMLAKQCIKDGTSVSSYTLTRVGVVKESPPGTAEYMEQFEEAEVKYYVIVTRSFDWKGCDDDEPRWSASVDLRGPFASEHAAERWGDKNVDLTPGLGWDWYVRSPEEVL